MYREMVDIINQFIIDTEELIKENEFYYSMLNESSKQECKLWKQLTIIDKALDKACKKLELFGKTLYEQGIRFENIEDLDLEKDIWKEDLLKESEENNEKDN